MASRKHGTEYCYVAGCRCEECRRAGSEAHRRRRAVAKAKPTPDHVHGTDNGYNYYGCRCALCLSARRARSEYVREYQRRNRDKYRAYSRAYRRRAKEKLEQQEALEREKRARNL